MFIKAVSSIELLATIITLVLLGFLVAHPEGAQ